MNSRRPPQHNVFLKLTVFVLLLLTGAGGFAYIIYLRLFAPPPPTIAGWKARVATLAGDGSPGFADAAVPAQARFADPFGVAVDTQGNVYVADAGDSNRIRKITRDGNVSTLAGGTEGFADGASTAAAFNTPSSIALDEGGNLFVADTGNNRIRKITPAGIVSTVAGDGTAGYRDGAAGESQFNAPVGVAVDERGNVYVADTYNDRIRQITPEGQVKTIAGGATPGYADGAATDALFDTPCALVAAPEGELFIADTGNDRIRKLTRDGRVITVALNLAGADEPDVLRSPMGLALTFDGFLYATGADGARVVQISPDGSARIVAGGGAGGFADGAGETARFNNPSGIALDERGALVVADSANYLVRRVAPVDEINDAEITKDAKNAKDGARAASADVGSSADKDVLPRLTGATPGVGSFPWPVEPQRERHEVVATMGEVRGSFDGESRHHLHSGIDVPGAYGATVRAVHDEKVASPLSNWGFGSLNEGLRVGLMVYVHLNVGRTMKDEPLDAPQFVLVRDAEGKPARVRVRRGARFRVGDALGTINRMYHVHLNFGPSGAEANPLVLPFVGFGDHVAPTIERDGIQLFNASGQPLKARRNGRLLVSGDVHIVVDAYDQVDGNAARRRLGLYKLGYQILRADGTPAPGFDQPRIQLEFNRLPPDRDAVKIAYADRSGITVYGNAATKFLYVVTNTVRDGRTAEGVWKTSELPHGDYLLRILAADFAGNEATAGRDLQLTVE